MKIIKEGDLKFLQKVKTFTCHNCGCIFEANKNEYKMGMQYNEEYYYCICQFCNATVYTEGK